MVGRGHGSACSVRSGQCFARFCFALITAVSKRSARARGIAGRVIAAGSARSGRPHSLAALRRGRTTRISTPARS